MAVSQPSRRRRLLAQARNQFQGFQRLRLLADLNQANRELPRVLRASAGGGANSNLLFDCDCPARDPMRKRKFDDTAEMPIRCPFTGRLNLL